MKKWIVSLILLAGCLNNTTNYEPHYNNISLVLFMKEMASRGIPVYCKLPTMNVIITPEYSIFYIDNNTYVEINNTIYDEQCRFATLFIHANYTYLPEPPILCKQIFSYDLPCKIEQNQS